MPLGLYDVKVVGVDVVVLVTRRCTSWCFYICRETRFPWQKYLRTRTWEANNILCIVPSFNRVGKGDKSNKDSYQRRTHMLEKDANTTLYKMWAHLIASLDWIMLWWPEQVPRVQKQWEIHRGAVIYVKIYISHEKIWEDQNIRNEAYYLARAIIQWGWKGGKSERRRKLKFDLNFPS